MRRAFLDFARSSRGQVDATLIFYAGHEFRLTEKTT